MRIWPELRRPLAAVSSFAMLAVIAQACAASESGLGPTDAASPTDATLVDSAATDTRPLPVIDANSPLDAGLLDAADTGPTAVGYGTRVHTNLVALYEMEEGAGTTLNDTSGFGAPLPLTFMNASAGDVNWTNKGAVSAINNNYARSNGAATKIIDACKASSEVTLEAWTTLGMFSGRILTIGTGNNDFNALIGLATTGAAACVVGGGLLVGADRFYQTANIACISSPAKHLAVTFASNTMHFYVDGLLVQTYTENGDLMGWSQSVPLALFNADALGTPYRPMFSGAIHLVAIYSRALTPAEVSTNFAAGPDP